jgi:aldose 1-epimerase
LNPVWSQEVRLTAVFFGASGLRQFHSVKWLPRFIIFWLFDPSTATNEVVEDFAKMNETKMVNAGFVSGKEVHQIILSTKSGLRVTLLSYGATLVSVLQPDSSGKPEEVTANYSSLDDVVADPLGGYFGVTAGRVANRICKGRFTLQGTEYTLPINNGENSLHGGLNGFNKQIWDAKLTKREQGGVNESGCEFRYVSAHMEEGYPCRCVATVSYWLNERNELSIDFTVENQAVDTGAEAATETGMTTIAALTNHTYWNLSGGLGRSMLEGQELRTFCSHFLPVDAHQIPTGEVKSVRDDPRFDFTGTGRPLGPSQDPDRAQAGVVEIDGGGKPGIDHCLVVDGSATLSQAQGQASYGGSGDVPSGRRWVQSSDQRALMRPVLHLADPESGRSLEVSSTFPGVQLYTGNWLPPPQQPQQQQHVAQAQNQSQAQRHNQSQGRQAPSRLVQYCGLAVETQEWPDAVNNPNFPTVVLERGERRSHRTRYAFFW